MTKWKSWIKGIYDTEGVSPRILITGSAHLDIFRKGSDSLACRHLLYFYDTGRVSDSGGARLENAVACALLKRAHFLMDTKGIKSELFYLRDREQREVDFLTVSDQKLEYMIEVKTSDDQFAPSLRYFS